MNELKMSVCMPVYNGARVIRETLDGLLSQSFRDFELVVCDNASTDETRDIVSAMHDPRIRLLKNETNLGYPRNLQRCLNEARNDIVVMMGHDDIPSPDMLQKIHDAFARNPNAGALTRAYYWFQGDTHQAVRAKPPVDPKGDIMLSLRDADPEMAFRAFSSMDQLSGLALRREWIDCEVSPHMFLAHVYPVASILRKHDLYCLKDNTIAVRIDSSMCRSTSSIYDPSPVWTWAHMFETVYPEPEFDRIRKLCIRDFVARNYVGLVQIRNYGKYSWLLREIGMLLRYRWQNIFSFQFWFFSLGCMIMPPALLIRMVDVFKRKCLSRAIGPVGLRGLEDNEAQKANRTAEDAE